MLTDTLLSWVQSLKRLDVRFSFGDSLALPFEFGYQFGDDRCHEVVARCGHDDSAAIEEIVCEKHA